MPESVTRCDAATTPLRIIGEPWWLYSLDDYPGRTREEVIAGLTVPAVKESE